VTRWAGVRSDGRRRSGFVTTCAATTPAAAAPSSDVKDGRDDRVEEIRTVEEFDAAIKNAGRKLVVVEYAGSKSKNSRNIYPAMVDLSRTSQNAVFLLVMGDETDDTKELCRRAGIEKVGLMHSFSSSLLNVDAEETLWIFSPSMRLSYCAGLPQS
jgi:hypothetical protein